MIKISLYVLVLSTTVVSLVFLFSFSVISVAHKGATGVVKKRMDAMKSIAAQMKQINTSLSDKLPYSADKVKQAATIIKQHSKNVSRFFPKGSLQHPTEASEKIWQDWQMFQELSNYMLQYASVLAIAADNPSDTNYKTTLHSASQASKDIWVNPNELESLPPQAAFSYLSQTCKSCHQSFRINK